MRDAGAAPALVPRPLHVAPGTCAGGPGLRRPLRFSAAADPGGMDIVRERWSALGIPAPVTSARGAVPDVESSIDPALPARAYRLTVDRTGIRIVAGDAEAAFDALATLAQLPERDAGGWRIACTAIDDRPALRWRIVLGRHLARAVSDDDLLQDAHPHAGRAQGQRLLAVHGKRVRRPGASVRRVFRAANGRRASRARGVRAPVPRRARSRASRRSRTCTKR